MLLILEVEMHACTKCALPQVHLRSRRGSVPMNPKIRFLRIKNIPSAENPYFRPTHASTRFEFARKLETRPQLLVQVRSFGPFLLLQRQLLGPRVVRLAATAACWGRCLRLLRRETNTGPLSVTDARILSVCTHISFFLPLVPVLLALLCLFVLLFLLFGLDTRGFVFEKPVEQTIDRFILRALCPLLPLYC